jgi:hypothetical protein
MRDRLEIEVLSAMDRASATPMQWGRDDCALWCADVLRAALGYDAAERFRGRYKTRIGARRVLGRGGLAVALRVAARRFGWRRIKAGEEACGDVGLFKSGGALTTVVCRAPGWFVARNETGFTVIPARSVRVAWAVA